MVGHSRSVCRFGTLLRMWVLWMGLGGVIVALPWRTADALSFEGIQIYSTVGQPFAAEVLLRVPGGVSAAGWQVSLGSESDYRHRSLHRASVLDQMQVALLERDGLQYVNVTSADPVRETFFHLLVKVNDGRGNYLRHYPVLLPGQFGQSGFASPVISSLVPEPEPEPPPPPVKNRSKGNTTAQPVGVPAVMPSPAVSAASAGKNFPGLPAPGSGKQQMPVSVGDVGSKQAEPPAQPSAAGTMAGFARQEELTTALKAVTARAAQQQQQLELLGSQIREMNAALEQVRTTGAGSGSAVAQQTPSAQSSVQVPAAASGPAVTAGMKPASGPKPVSRPPVVVPWWEEWKEVLAGVAALLLVLGWIVMRRKRAGRAEITEPAVATDTVRSAPAGLLERMRPLLQRVQTVVQRRREKTAVPVGKVLEVSDVPVAQPAMAVAAAGVAGAMAAGMIDLAKPDLPADPATDTGQSSPVDLAMSAPVAPDDGSAPERAGEIALQSDGEDEDREDEEEEEEELDIGDLNDELGLGSLSSLPVDTAMDGELEDETETDIGSLNDELGLGSFTSRVAHDDPEGYLPDEEEDGETPEMPVAPSVERLDFRLPASDDDDDKDLLEPDGREDHADGAAVVERLEFHLPSGAGEEDAGADDGDGHGVGPTVERLEFHLGHDDEEGPVTFVSPFGATQEGTPTPASGLGGGSGMDEDHVIEFDLSSLIGTGDGDGTDGDAPRIAAGGLHKGVLTGETGHDEADAAGRNPHDFQLRFTDDA